MLTSQRHRKTGKSTAQENEFIRVASTPYWEPEELLETWPTVLQQIQKFYTRMYEPDLSLPVADLELG
jgi:Mlc titration factor MtfA (ptsG expression regulator)